MQIWCTLKRIQLLPYAEWKQQSIMHALHQAYGNVISPLPPHKVQICRCTTYLKVSFKIILVSLRRARTLANNKQCICEKKGREAAEVCLPLAVEVTLENWTGGDNTFLPPVLTVRRLSGFLLFKENGAIENFLRHNAVCVSPVFFFTIRRWETRVPDIDINWRQQAALSPLEKTATWS